VLGDTEVSKLSFRQMDLGFGFEKAKGNQGPL